MGARNNTFEKDLMKGNQKRGTLIVKPEVMVESREVIVSDIEWKGLKMGRTAMGCCFEEEKVYCKLSREVAGTPPSYVHCEKLKGLNAFGPVRRFERIDKAVWKLNNNNWDCKVKFSLHL